MQPDNKSGVSDLPARTTTESRLSAPPNAIILLFDSDSVMRAALRDALQSAGYVVLAVGDLGAAIDGLEEAQPDLLITRPSVSGMPGRIAADYLRIKCPGLPVLIVGGYMNDDRVNVQNAVERFEVFPQPFSRNELLAKVRDVFNNIRSQVGTPRRKS